MGEGSPVATRVTLRPLATPLPLGFLARDPVAATGMGVPAGTWAVVGLTTLISPPGSTSRGLAVLLASPGCASW